MRTYNKIEKLGNEKIEKLSLLLEVSNGEPRLGAAAFIGYAISADPPSAIGDRWSACSLAGRRAGAREAPERRLRDSWEVLARFMEGS